MTAKENWIKMAIASDFLTAFSRIPRTQQAKVLEFINKFRADPTSSAIHYEKIQRARNPNLHSVRIDQSYRGIVLKPDTGNVHVLLWVDHHDKAYQWAENKLCNVHPETGSLQLLDVEEARITPVSPAEASEAEADDLDGGPDDQKGYKSLLHGVAPEVRRFGSFREEVEFIARYLQQVEGEGDSLKEVCLVARTNDLLKQYESALGERGLETHFIRRSEPEDRRALGVRLATMHRVKGLEFDRVIIAGVNAGIVPYEGVESESSDPVVRRESEVHERALLYVSATRAKKEVMVTSFGKASQLLPKA